MPEEKGYRPLLSKQPKNPSLSLSGTVHNYRKQEKPNASFPLKHHLPEGKQGHPFGSPATPTVGTVQSQPLKTKCVYCADV